jgi:hypothetical protein
MDALTGLRNADTILHQMGARIPALAGRLDDLNMRAHRIASAKRSGNGTHHDPTFVHDIQIFRRELNTLGQDLELLPDVMSRVHRVGEYVKEADDMAISLQRLCDRLGKMIANLEDSARLAHSHIRNSDAAVEAWYVVQQTAALAEKWRPVSKAAERTAFSFAAGRPS